VGGGTAAHTTEEEGIADTMGEEGIADPMVDIMVAGPAAHTTDSPSVGVGSARRGILMAPLILIRTTTPTVTPTIRIALTRTRMSSLPSIANRSNSTGTIARIRKAIIRMSTTALVGG
jgi:hypothetical protein